jgi:leucyl-tRNA synthetase
LPVTLPDDVSFDKPGNPLAHHPSWKHVKCPNCGGDATRETDTFDTFIDSSWYFARFAGLKEDRADRPRRGRLLAAG